MVKKLKALAKSDDIQLAEAVRNSAQQIWQAGLGAFAKAQEEGSKVFTRLVKEGGDLQKRTQKLAEYKVSGVTDTVSKMAGNVGKQASGSWDKLEQVFEDRVSRALGRLGVPSQKDIQALSKHVEELNNSVALLTRKKSSTLSKAGKSNPKSSASKPAAVKKISAKPVAKKTGPKLVAIKKPATKVAA